MNRLVIGGICFHETILALFRSTFPCHFFHHRSLDSTIQLLLNGRANRVHEYLNVFFFFSIFILASSFPYFIKSNQNGWETTRNVDSSHALIFIHFLIFCWLLVFVISFSLLLRTQPPPPPPSSFTHSSFSCNRSPCGWCCYWLIVTSLKFKTNKWI